MNSIAKALNNIAQSLQSITNAILVSKKLDVKPTTTTSNPTSNVTITKTELYPQRKPSSNFALSHVTVEEKNALDAIYKALTDKGNHPEHHDHIMRELSTKWPVLYKALDSLLIARKNRYNKSNSYYIYDSLYDSSYYKNTSSKDIWKY